MTKLKNMALACGDIIGVRQKNVKYTCERQKKGKADKYLSKSMRENVLVCEWVSVYQEKAGGCERVRVSISKRE